MTEDRQRIRDRHDEELESSTRFGDWSLDKYKQNSGFVVYHWVCGYWTHTFYNNTKNCCCHCTFGNVVVDFPEELENVYRIANFDLMNTVIYNASIERRNE